MWTKFLEGVGGKLADQWTAALFGPAFVFWAGGVLGLFWHTDSITWSTGLISLACARSPVINSWFCVHHGTVESGLKQPLLHPSNLSTASQLILLVVGLLVIATSASVLERFLLPVLRFLEGYWPHWMQGYWQRRVHAVAERRKSDLKEWQDLEQKGIETLSATESNRHADLDERILRIPALPQNQMPTRLGNILRISELHPRVHYGLNAPICWPRLWLVLPDGTKQELSAARASLDVNVRIWCWALLFTIWTIWAWWALPLGMLGAWFAYKSMCDAAMVYGDLVKAAFDVHRSSLYEALHWPVPHDPASEPEIGKTVSKYLMRGSQAPTPVFTNAPSPPSPSTAERIKDFIEGLAQNGR